MRLGSSQVDRATLCDVCIKYDVDVLRDLGCHLRMPKVASLSSLLLLLLRTCLLVFGRENAFLFG